MEMHIIEYMLNGCKEKREVDRGDKLTERLAEIRRFVKVNVVKSIFIFNCTMTFGYNFLFTKSTFNAC